MRHKIDEELHEGLPSTLFLILWVQYLVSISSNSLLKDEKVQEIVESLDFDFTQFSISTIDQLVVANRKLLIRDAIFSFEVQNPNGVVVNLGCGMDTYNHYFRGGDLSWYDVDLPPVIALRKKFFPDTEKHKNIAKSIMDFSWVNDIPKEYPVLILMEGLLVFFPENEVYSLLTHIERSFPRGEMLVHSASPRRIRKRHEMIKKANLRFQWGMERSDSILHWFKECSVANEWYVFKHNAKQWPLHIRLLNLIKSRAEQEKITHFTFSSAS